MPNSPVYLQHDQAQDVGRWITHVGIPLDLFAWGTQDASEFTGSSESEADVVYLKQNRTAFFAFAVGPDEHTYRARRYGQYGYPWNGRWCVRYRPGSEEPTSELYYQKWDDVGFEVTSWAGRIKRELEEPNIWTLAEGERQSFENAIHDTNNEPLSQTERQGFAAAVDTLSLQIRELRVLSEAQYQDLSTQLSELKRASERVGRKDLALVTIGTVVGNAAVQHWTGQAFTEVMHRIPHLVAAIGHSLPGMADHAGKSFSR